MKAMKNYIWMAAIALTAATLTACSNEDEAVTEKDKAQQSRVVTLVTTLSPMSGPTTRTTITEESSALALGWEVGDYVWVNYTNTLDANVEAQGTVTAVDGSGNATISVELTNPKDGESSITFGFPYNHWHDGIDAHAGQVGTLADIVANHAASSGSGTLNVTSGTATLPTGVAMTPEMCIWKLSFTDGSSDITSSITSLTVSLGASDDYVITPSSLSNIYVAFYGDANPRNVSIKASTASQVYFKGKSGITLAAGKMYTTSGLALVQAELGKVIAADGNIYNTASAATAAGTTASGIIAYIGAAGSVDTSTSVDANCSTYKGLAIALTDASTSSAWSTYDATCASQTTNVGTALGYKNGIASTNTLTSHVHAHAAASAAKNFATARPGGVSTWFLPSLGQWNLICQGLATKKAGSTVSTNLSTSSNDTFKASNLNSVITDAGGTEFPTGEVYYWLSTEYNTANAWHYYKSGSVGFGDKDFTHYVRAVFAF